MCLPSRSSNHLEVAVGVVYARKCEPVRSSIACKLDSIDYTFTIERTLKRFVISEFLIWVIITFA